MAIVPDRDGSADTEVTKSPQTGPQGNERIRAFAPLLFVLAILLAPLLASMVRIEAGLLVMGVALSATAFLLRGSLGEAPPRLRRPLWLLLVLNLVLAIACFVAAVIRLASS